MDNHLLVAELKAASPGAVKAIHDSYAHGLFTYCWFMLRNADAAQVAVRDSLLVAQAHIARLAEPELLKPWLYALARVECLRRRPSPASEPGVHAAGQGEEDAGAVLMAWHAVMDLDPLEREALELSTRQRLGLADVAQVLGIPMREAELLLIRARDALERALAAQILARAGAGGCADWAAILADWDGTLTAPVREELVRHAAGCTACAQRLPRNVSAAKVYSFLPVPDPPVEMQHRALACFDEPELAGYRAFVAGRAARLGHTGFPVSADAVAATTPQRRTGAHLWVGLAAALAATAAGAVVAVSRLGSFDGLFHGKLTGSAGSARRGAVSAPAAGTGAASGTGRARVQVGRPITPTTPLGVAGGGAAPPGPARSVFPSHPARWPLRGAAPLPSAGLKVSSRLLDLGAASAGTLTLSTIAGQVAWSATTSSPELGLSSYGGSLPTGGTVTLTVTLTRDSSRYRSATILVGPGDLNVLVSWLTAPPSRAARPALSPPAPQSASPSASPLAQTPHPVPSGTPSPWQRPSSVPPRTPPRASSPRLPARSAAAQAPMTPAERPWVPRGQGEPWEDGQSQPRERDGWRHWQPYERRPWWQDQWRPWWQDQRRPWWHY